MKISAIACQFENQLPVEYVVSFMGILFCEQSLEPFIELHSPPMLYNIGINQVIENDQ
jgi:hypothetical protein